MIFYNFKLNAHQNLLTLEPSANSMCESPIEYDILVGKIHTKLNQFLDKEFSKYSIVMQAYDLQDYLPNPRMSKNNCTRFCLRWINTKPTNKQRTVAKIGYRPSAYLLQYIFVM